ncbi:GSU2403 family nucleotidyltransferase fold protein [Sagittula sp. SSi028]|uniref:nucleotidyltransferase family protein n=1 Tax=Sagittula sp. SSi028 TaxID=3400636 RepID=UPI003AF9E13E
MADLRSGARSAYSDLLRLLQDDRVGALRGSVRSKTIGGKLHWYSTERIGRDLKWWYIGPDTDDTRHRIDQLRHLQEQAPDRRRERARLVRLLRAEGLTPMDRETGSLLYNMAKVGTFRLGGTLIGTHAFRLMEGELGVTLPQDGAETTGDVDIAQFERLSLALGDQVEPSLADTFSALKFDPIDGLDRNSVWRWQQAKSGTLIEFLTPSFEEDEGIKALPALGVKARALHHLNYLIADPIPAAALYREGVLVQIPRPERFAIHKLIVADRRREGPDADKAHKDRRQAAWLIEQMADDRPADLWEAYSDALSRGPKWRARIESTLKRMPDTQALLDDCAEG